MKSTIKDLQKCSEHRVFKFTADEVGAISLVTSSNIHCAVFKTASETRNFYRNTKTLQVQGGGWDRGAYFRLGGLKLMSVGGVSKLKKNSLALAI